MDHISKRDYGGRHHYQHHSRNDSDDTGGINHGANKRRPRNRLSCAECRRLKLKCDRVWPCSSCTKRGCARICPDGTLQAKVRSKDTSALLSKIAELENALRARDKQITAALSGDMQTVAELRDLQQAQQVQAQAREEAAAAAQVQAQGFGGGVNTELIPLGGMPDYSLAHQGQHGGYDFCGNDADADLGVNGLLDGIGTLNVSGDGRSRYLGLSAGSAYLDADDSSSSEVASTHGTSEDYDSSVAANGSFRSTSRSRVLEGLGNGGKTLWDMSVKGAGVGQQRQSLSVTALKANLPPKQEAARLGNIYYSIVSYFYEPFERKDFLLLVDEAYGDHRDQICSTRLALLFIIFALGVLFDPALPSMHPDTDKYHRLAESCLSATDYLTSPTLAAIQTLHLMGTLLLNSREDAGETVWGLLGVGMKLAQAMGLHRDGSNWGLEQPDLDHRRRTFHDLLSMDRLQALGMGRPYSISDKHFDTSIPAADEIGQQEAACRVAMGGGGGDDNEESAAGFHLAKWRLSAVVGKIVDEAFSIVPPSYAIIQALDNEIRSFDQGLPDGLRCAAVPNMAPASIFARHDAGYVARGTPNLRLTMQQHTLAVLSNQTLLFLHRRAFAQALSDSADPMQSSFAPSVATVILESAKNLISVAKSAQEIYDLSNRWWHIFFHAYSGAACQAALLIKAPGSMLAQNAWEQLSAAMTVFESAAQHGPLARDLLFRLKRLQKQAMSSVTTYQQGLAPPKPRRLSAASHAQGLRPLSRIRGGDQEEGSTPMPSGTSGDHRSSSSDGDEIPPELGATTRLTRRSPRRRESVSGSSVASGRVHSVSSSRSRGTSFGGSSSTSDHEPNSWRSSWNGPPDDFEEQQDPPPWQNLSIEPRESFSPVFSGQAAGPSAANRGSFFSGFNEAFHPPMVLPAANNRVLTAGAGAGTTSGNNYSYGPAAPFDSPRLHPLPPSVHGSPPLGPIPNMSRSASQAGRRGDDGLTSPVNANFELLDTFLTWQAYDQPYDAFEQQDVYDQAQ